jgi:hypothetical protein
VQGVGATGSSSQSLFSVSPLCSLLSAHCSLLSALCSLLSALCPTLRDSRSLCLLPLSASLCLSLPLSASLCPSASLPLCLSASLPLCLSASLSLSASLPLSASCATETRCQMPGARCKVPDAFDQCEMADRTTAQPSSLQEVLARGYGAIQKEFFGQILEISLPKSSKSGVFTPFSAFSGHFC